MDQNATLKYWKQLQLNIFSFGVRWLSKESKKIKKQCLPSNINYRFPSKTSFQVAVEFSLEIISKSV